tara:strand:- start:3976 stop:4227 length:252 start_codon:yes stop_codon:yes gene_type:complete
MVKVRKTKLMKRVERSVRMPLEEAIPKLVTDLGFGNAAERMKLSKPTLHYWMTKFHVRTVIVAVGEEDVLAMQRTGRGEIERL